jgi:hypothetical protein
LRLLWGLVEEVLQTHLEFPTLSIVLIGLVGLGGIFATNLHHREHRRLIIIHTLILQDSIVEAIARGDRHLRDTPCRVDQVADVQEVKTYLELVLLLASLETEVLSDAEIEAVYPR